MLPIIRICPLQSSGPESFGDVGPQQSISIATAAQVKGAVMPVDKAWGNPSGKGLGLPLEKDLGLISGGEFNAVALNSRTNPLEKSSRRLPTMAGRAGDRQSPGL